MWIVCERHRETGVDGETENGERENGEREDRERMERERERGRQTTSVQLVDLVYILCVRDTERQG